MRTFNTIIRILLVPITVWLTLTYPLATATAEDDGLPGRTKAHSSTQGLHLVQRFELLAGNRSIYEQDHDLFVQGNMLVMHSGQTWFLVRNDLQTAWLMDENRRALSTIPVSQIIDKSLTGTHAPPSPPLRPTGESKTIAGYACRVYRGHHNEVSADTCLTRNLPALEQFQTLFGARPETPGIPLELIITMQQPGKDRVTFTQRVTRVTVGPVDPALFAPPTAAPARGR